MNLDLQKVLPAEAFETEQNEGDYIGKDGLLYCGVCRTKKQTRLPASDFTGGREIIVPCICKCKVEENKRKEEEEKKRQEMQRLERLKASSLMDAKLKAARLDGYQVDGDNQKIYNLASNYVKRFDEMYEKRQRKDVSGRGNAGCKDNCILRNSEVHQQEEAQGNVGTQDQTNQEAGLG